VTIVVGSLPAARRIPAPG